MDCVLITASVGLIASEEHMKALDDAMKVTKVEPTTEKAIDAYANDFLSEVC